LENSGFEADRLFMRIYIKVIPRSSRNKIEKISEGEYKAWVTAPPTDNKANQALIELLSDYFNKPKSYFQIKAGKTAKTKIIDID
jgi:uncharacterized protein (TIGR00251 family)